MRNVLFIQVSGPLLKYHNLLSVRGWSCWSTCLVLRLVVLNLGCARQQPHGKGSPPCDTWDMESWPQSELVCPIFQMITKCARATRVFYSYIPYRTPAT